MTSAMRLPRAAGAGEGAGEGAGVALAGGVCWAVAVGVSRGVGTVASDSSDSRTFAVAWFDLLPASDAVTLSAPL
jgi:hypothetical protein